LLTTVSQPFEAMARMAAALLRQRVDEAPADAAQRELLAGTLIERGSTQLLPDSPSR
jgi:DNA-binding LacI/PurR family transcriptional regulator